MLKLFPERHMLIMQYIMILRDDSTFIQKKTPNSTYLFTMIYKGEKYGVWIDYKEGLEFVSKDIDPSCLLVYSLTMADHSPNTLLLKGQNHH